MNTPLMGPQSHVSCLFITIDSEPQQNEADLIGIIAGDNRDSFLSFGVHESGLF